MKEQTIQSSIIKYLESKGCYVVKVISANKIGVPDLLCCINGRFVGIEVKTNKGIVSSLQIVQIERINKAEGIAFVCRSVEELKKQTEELL